MNMNISYQSSGGENITAPKESSTKTLDDVTTWNSFRVTEPLWVTGASPLKGPQQTNKQTIEQTVELPIM